MESTVTGTGATVQADRHRLMGWLAIGGAILYVIVGIAYTVGSGEPIRALEVLGLLWALGCIAGLIGIGMIGAVGHGLFGRIALGVAVLAYTLAALDSLLFLAGLYSIEESPLFIVSRLGTLVGMLLVGIATLVSRRWAGWRKFSPLALPLVLPLALLVGLVFENVSMPVLVGLAWLIIGTAIVTTPDEI